MRRARTRNLHVMLGLCQIQDNASRVGLRLDKPQSSLTRPMNPPIQADENLMYKKMAKTGDFYMALPI